MSKDAFNNEDFWSQLENLELKLGSGSDLETKLVLSDDELSSNTNPSMSTIDGMSSLPTSSDEKNEMFFQSTNPSVPTIFDKKEPELENFVLEAQKKISERQRLLILNNAYGNALKGINSKSTGSTRNKKRKFKETPNSKPSKKSTPSFSTYDLFHALHTELEIESGYNPDDEHSSSDNDTSKMTF